jgi:hypothetical protein
MAARSRSHVARLLPTGCRPVNRTTRPIERRVVRSGALPGPGRLDTAVSSVSNQQTRDDRPVRQERPCFRREGECLTRMDQRLDSPQSAGRSARGKTHRRGAISGERRDTGSRSNRPSRAHSGATIAKISASTALELSVAASARPVSSRLARSRAFGWRSTGSHRPSAALGRWGSAAMSGCPNSQRGLPGSRSRSVIPLAGKLLGDEPAASDESADARARGRARTNFSGLVHINAPTRSTVVDELALRPGFSAQAWKPPTALLAPRGERRGLLVFDCGAGDVLLWALPHRPGGRVPT